MTRVSLCCLMEARVQNATRVSLAGRQDLQEPQRQTGQCLGWMPQEEPWHDGVQGKREANPVGLGQDKA